MRLSFARDNEESFFGGGLLGHVRSIRRLKLSDIEQALPQRQDFEAAVEERKRERERESESERERERVSE